MTFLPYYWLKQCQNLEGVTPASIIVKCMPWCIGFTMIVQWAFQNRPAVGIGATEINLMILTIYLSCILSLVFIIVYPRLVNLEEQKSKAMPKV